MQNPLLSSGLIVFLFWWGLLAYFGAADDYSFDELAYNAIMVAVGASIGMFVTWAHMWLNRIAVKQRMEPKSKRGLVINMGLLPALMPEPKRGTHLPNLHKLKFPPGTDLDFLDRWRERYRTSHPAHVALLNAILKVLMADPTIPGSHLKGGHGGRTLLEHALLAANQMEIQAAGWQWDGNRGKSTKTLLIPMRNPQYRFQPDDPLVMIIGLAHDIGKLESYIFDSACRVVGSKHEHDIVGAHMLGRLPELWALPDIDREVLLLSVGHYHHVRDMPMDEDNKPRDDRLMCVTELLIHVDSVTSKLEEGKSREDAERAAAEVPSEGKQDTLMTAFADIVAEGDRINGNDKDYRVGQKLTLDGRPYLFFHEASLMKEIAERTGFDAMAMMGHGQFRLSRDLLLALDEKDVLYKTHAGKEYGALSAQWKVEFRKKNGEFLAEWASTIIVRITDTFLPAMLNMDDADVIPLIKRPLFGEQRAKRGNTGAALDSFAEMDPADVQAAATLQPGTPKKPKLSLVLGGTGAEAAADAAAVPSAADAPADQAPDPFADESARDTGDTATPKPTAAPALSDLERAESYRAMTIEMATVIAKRIDAGRQQKIAKHPTEEGITVVRASNATPANPDFSWETALPAIAAGFVPGLRYVEESVDGATVVFLLFNVKVLLAGDGTGTERALAKTGEMPELDRHAGDDHDSPDDPF